MKTFELRLDTQPFENIKAGKKTIEMRLLDEKRQQYSVGDVLIFKKRPEEVETLRTKIIALHKYHNFEEMYKHFNKISLGYTEYEIANPKDMESFYSIEEQQKYGVVGIELEII